MSFMISNLYSVTHQFNPDCLRIAREFRGYQKNELAKLIDISPSALTQFENGSVKPNAQTTGRLSMVLGFPVTFFAKRDLKIISSDQCHFRSLVKSTQIERRKMISAATILASTVDFLEEYIDLPSEQISKYIVGRLKDSNEIEKAAVELRRAWGLGLGPISNMTCLLESKGILVFRLLSDCKNVDGFSFWQNDRPFVFLNAEKECASRSRLDLAHELGHLLMHTDCLPGELTQELEAFRFGAAFLFPRESFFQEFPKRLVWPHLMELKSRWGISLSALVRRAKDLDIFSSATYKRANLWLSSNGYKTTEPNEPELEFPTIFPQFMRLLEGTGMGRAKIAEQVDLFEQDLFTLVYSDSPDLLKNSANPSPESNLTIGNFQK